jgi:hypothetical protein
MSPSTRTLRVAGLAVAVLLLWLAVYPGTVASPYVAEDSREYYHQIIPETAAEYNETVEQAPTYNYSDLSPTAQTFVDRTRAAPNTEYTPVVCEEFVLTCDEYTRDELPEEFTYGEDLELAEATVVIRDGDEQFLLQTGMVGHGWFGIPVRVLTAWLTMIPLGVFVGKVALRTERERLLGGAVGAGIVVAIAGFAAPYTELVGVLQARTIGFLLLGSVWIGLLGRGGYWLARRFDTQTQE